MRDLVLDAPLLQVALALTLVVAAAALLYRIDRGNRHLPAGLRAALGIVRAATLAVLVLLLFRPVLRSKETAANQPSLLVLQDASRSVADEAPAWASNLDTWMAELPGEEGQAGADVQAYAFGSDLSQWTPGQSLEDPTTDLSSALDLLAGQWAGRPIGAIVLATDGRFNRGRDPELEGLSFGAPVHIIALGDTAFKKDVRIDRVLHNDVAGLGNRFPIEVEIGAQAVGDRLQVTLSGSGIRQQETVTLQRGGAPATVTFLVEADRPGIRRYTLAVDTVEGEVNRDNNRRTITIDVIERRKRILLTSAAPHPDRGAWANALSGNANYEVVQRPLKDVASQGFPGDDEWDGLLMFGFDPGNATAREVFVAAKQSRVPIGLTIGPTADFGALRDLGIGLDVRPTREGLTTDPKGTVNPAFPYFAVDPALDNLLVEVPPVVTPFGEVTWGAAHVPLLFQRIGGITTEYPLLTVAQTESGRLMTLLGAGSWRWRQVGYLRTGTHEAFDKMVGQLVQYLTSDPGIDRFRVDGPRLLDEDERLTFQARAYDATLQPLLGADISLTLRDSAGTEFDFRFSATAGTGYALDAGRLPKGTYSWNAVTELAGERFERRGTVNIRGIQIERSGRPAQHDRLRRMAEATGGQVFAPSELDALTEKLTASDRFLPDLSFTELLQDLMAWQSLLWILLLLLSIEWFARRWAGTY